MKNILTFFNFIFLFLLTLGFSLASARVSYANDPIIRSYKSVRANGMGNVRYTTGLYEENFFANPARITANPESLFQLPKFSIEVGSGVLGSITDLTNSDGLNGFSKHIGEPLSASFQMTFPAWYSKEFLADFWAFGIGMTMNSQVIATVGQTGLISPLSVFTVGPSISIGRRLLPGRPLSVGLNLHTHYRASAKTAIGISDFLSGKNMGTLAKNSGGSGLGLDADLGATYRAPWDLLDFQYEFAFTLNQLLGGNFSNLGGKVGDLKNDPLPTQRSVNFGVSAKRSISFLDQWLLALEVTDLGNNPHGSFFKTLHLGTEAKWKVLAARLGVNQGYFTAGFGIDAHYFMINFASYGEELGLNAGVKQDRRYAIDFGFQI